MDTFARSHRRAVWLIVALGLASVAGGIGYELNWIRQRHVFRADLEARWNALLNTGELAEGAADVAAQVLPASGAGVDQMLLSVLGMQSEEDIQVVCPSDNPSFLAKFQEGEFPMEAIEALPEVRHARWLFPEAGINFIYFTDKGKIVPIYLLGAE